MEFREKLPSSLTPKRYIQDNYSKIRAVECELANLSRKAALQLLRKKIEVSTEKIRVTKLKEEQARKAWESASNAVKSEEAIKQKLCGDVSNLVQESSGAQFSRLEELKRRLEDMNPSRASTNLYCDGRPTNSSQDGTKDNSSVPNNARESSGGSAESVTNQSNGQKVVVNGPNQQTPNEGEGRNKKKVNLQSKENRVGALPKGKSSGPGWTGAGYDVDSRT
ncbi:putative tonB-dependent receptor, plug domain-containing protein [Lupinus albus]|uniref:Putative tonB-dependent receptor, plug domain-containing protein n=1 Tax=Lupinus albus TaxID=3870 RepID=A0A6A4NN81_LUPAL|nr:putative tonB-dependent receptor, plug domain-containing protein [Lupinus albus]